MLHRLQLYDHTNYRSVLRAWLSEKRRSQTRLAKLVGLARSTVAMVLSGERHIALAQARAWGEAIGLGDGEELAYWEALVRSEQGETLALRRAARLHVRAMRDYRSAQRPSDEVAGLLWRWYVPVILELVKLPDFRLEAAWLHERLWPEVDEEVLEIVLHQVQATGLLGGSVATERELSGGLAEMARLYHISQLDHAKEALDKLPSTERYLASVTVAVRRDRMRELLDSIHRLHLEVVEPHHTDTPDTVVQLNVQLFPRLKP
jgi:uncharacterized protein (TIGR02147 family)